MPVGSMAPDANFIAQTSGVWQRVAEPADEPGVAKAEGPQAGQGGSRCAIPLLNFAAAWRVSRVKIASSTWRPPARSSHVAVPANTTRDCACQARGRPAEVIQSAPKDDIADSEVAVRTLHHEPREDHHARVQLQESRRRGEGVERRPLRLFNKTNTLSVDISTVRLPAMLRRIRLLGLAPVIMGRRRGTVPESEALSYCSLRHRQRLSARDLHLRACRSARSS